MKEENLNKLNEKISVDYKGEDLVLGNGKADSFIMLIGEAPGRKEVELKKPFVGQAGKYLEEFLEVLKVNRKDLYITNVVKYRPTKISKKTGGLTNRTPTKKEIDAFKQYLIEEIDIVNPKVIVTLGNTPLKSILGDDYTIGKVHGNVYEINISDKIYIVYPLYHPAAIIYNKSLKKVYIEDLLKLKKIIDNILKKC